MKTIVAFRVEGGGTIGMGHIMRCMSLASEFLRQGCDVFFISSIEEARSVIESNNMKLISQHEVGGLINSDITRLSCAELKEQTTYISEILHLINSNILILDSYNVSSEYMKKLKEQLNYLIYIDDINKFEYPADIIINGNITGPFLNYPEVSGQNLLLGTDFNLIREEFANIKPKKINTRIKNIMLTTGGSDPCNCSQEILCKIIDYAIREKISIHVVVGKAFSFENDLNLFAEKYKNVVLYKNIKKMSKLMDICDVAISAGGSTLYELCACGTPTLAFIMADNQEFVVNKMDELGYVKSLGWFDNINGTELTQYIDFLNSHFQYRIALSDKMQGLVDGKGTKRVVEKILEYTDWNRM